MALLTDITKNDLFNQGYPEEIKEVPEALYGISLNNAIWDIEHRTILKLGEGKQIVRATKGSRPMTQAEIEEIYGSPPIFLPLDYPNSKSQMREESGAYLTMMTYFDSVKLPVIAHGIDLMERGIITGKTNLDFANSIVQSVIR